MPDPNQANESASSGTPAQKNLLTGVLPAWTWAIWISALAWAVIFIAIPPAAQNFPLGDDWAFAHGAIWFAHGAGIHYSKWASMPQLGQWLWSWPFLHVTDLAHVALRVSVIVLSWLGLAAFYGLLRQAGVGARLAAFAACVLALNPLFFISSGTYMTDVPALSFALLALIFYCRAIDGKNLCWLLAAVLLAVLAVITRQTMLAVPVAAGILLLQHPELRRKPVWLLAILLPVAVCGCTVWWFGKRTDVLAMQPRFQLDEIIFRPMLALHWCGLAALPLVFLLAPPRRWKIFFLFFGLVILVAAGVCFFGTTMPYGGLFPYSTGMISLRGTYTEGLLVGRRDVLLGIETRIVITVLGCVGAARILTLLLEAVRARKIPNIVLLFTSLQFIIMLITPDMMDRYIEVLFPGVIFLLAVRCSGSGFGWPAGVLTLLVSGVLSVMLLHDWFAWNTVRWELGRQALVTQNIPPSDIEGGFEWNGWYATADPVRPLVGYMNPADRSDVGLTLPFTRAFFPLVTGRFALAYSSPSNSVIVASGPYTTWLPPAKKEFLFVQHSP